MYKSSSWKSARKCSVMSRTMHRMAAILAKLSAWVVRLQSVFTLLP
jgi:hypothetical protein